MFGKSESVWIDTTPSTNYKALEEDIECDVLVVGAGIVGVTTAWILSQTSRKVVLIEARRVLEGVTGYTTAKITSLHSLIYKHLLDTFGRSGALTYAEANQRAIEFIASLVEKEQIDCDFKRARAYTYTESKDSLGKLEEEYEVADGLQLPVQITQTTDLPFPVASAIYFENQAQFHPRKYLLTLLKKIEKRVQVFENTRAVEVKEGEPCEVKTERSKIRAKQVVLATNFPIYDPSAFFAKMYPKRSCVVAVEIDNVIPKDMYISMEDDFKSFRNQKTNGKTVVFVGGEVFKTGEGGDVKVRYERLSEYAQRIFKVKSIDYRWSTQDFVTIDGVPYIGKVKKDSKHVYVATGFGGWGMTNGTVSAMIISDMIQGKINPWAELFDPSRVKISSVPELMKINANAVGKHLIGDRFIKDTINSVDELKKDEAGILKQGKDKIAVYRDENDKLHSISAVCTHMGCLVDWNSGDLSWDCPCHGSRFDPDGEILHAPAVTPLEKKSV